MDMRRYLDRVLSIDPDTRTAWVEPGIILNSLQAAAAGYGLRFGPDPSAHARVTLGGVIGNNACGSHSVAFGTTADNVTELAHRSGARLGDGQALGLVTVRTADSSSAICLRAGTTSL